MSIIKMDSEIIAEIRNALCIIQLQSELMYLINEKLNISKRIKLGLEENIGQVKRIDRLLPKASLEGGEDGS